MMRNKRHPFLRPKRASLLNCNFAKAGRQFWDAAFQNTSHGGPVHLSHHRGSVSLAA
jgi:hypothetical protein